MKKLVLLSGAFATVLLSGAAPVESVLPALTIEAWRNEEVSFEIPVTGPGSFRAAVSGIPDAALAVVRGVKAADRVVLDRIEQGNALSLGAGETGVYYVTSVVARDLSAGAITGRVTIACRAADRTVTVSRVPLVVKVSRRVLPKLKRSPVAIDLRQHPWAVARYELVKPFSPEHYEKMRPLYKELAGAGQRSVTTTIVDLPWNHRYFDGYRSMVEHRQNADGSFAHDFTRFDEYVGFAFGCGLSRIQCHTMAPWGGAVRYKSAAGARQTALLRPDTKEHKAFWGSFLTALNAHIVEMGWTNRVDISLEGCTPECRRAIVPLIEANAPDVKTCGDEVHPPRGPNDLSFDAAWTALYAAVNGGNVVVSGTAFSWPEDPTIDAAYGDAAPGETFLLYPGAQRSLRLAHLRDGVEEGLKLSVLQGEGAVSMLLEAELKALFSAKRAAKLSSAEAAADVAFVRKALFDVSTR